MLSQEILNYQDSLKEGEKRNVLVRAELKSLLQATNIINDEISNLPTIEIICRRVGLNPGKLQYGFHSLYGLSVNNYVKKIRLQIAMDLLKNSDLSISEIVYKIGLSSRSYFSKIFKEKYGITPSYYKKKTDPGNSN